MPRKKVDKPNVKGAIDYIISIIISLRRRKSLNSLLGLSIILLAREVTSFISLSDTIIQALKESSFSASYPNIGAIIEVLSSIIFIKGNVYSLIVFVFIFIVCAALKIIELRSLDSPKFKRKLQEVEEAAEKRTDETVKRHTKILVKQAKQKNAQINLLNKLINKGLIEEEDVYNHIESGDLYAVYVYANTLPPAEGYVSKRLYPEFLVQEMNFIRMGRRSTLFVINTKRLPKNLRDTKNLKEYILKKLDDLLLQEWTAYIKWLKKSDKEELIKIYEQYKDTNYNKVLGLSITIIRGKFNEDNFGYLYEKVLTPKFYEMINEDIDLNNLHIKREKKIQVKKFVFDSSFELLFFGETVANLNKLKKLENKLKNTLDIKKFTDYQYQSKEDIANIFKDEFSIDKADEYAKKLIKESTKYETAFKALGISI